MLSRMSRLHVSDQLRGILIKPIGREIKGETAPVKCETSIDVAVEKDSLQGLEDKGGLR